jgi:hypothetical protein
MGAIEKLLQGEPSTPTASEGVAVFARAAECTDAHALKIGRVHY